MDTSTNFQSNKNQKISLSRKNTRDLLKHLGGSKESFARSYKIQKLIVSEIFMNL